MYCRPMKLAAAPTSLSRCSLTRVPFVIARRTSRTVARAAFDKGDSLAWDAKSLSSTAGASLQSSDLDANIGADAAAAQAELAAQASGAASQSPAVQDAIESAAAEVTSSTTSIVGPIVDSTDVVAVTSSAPAAEDPYAMVDCNDPIPPATARGSGGYPDSSTHSSSNGNGLATSKKGGFRFVCPICQATPFQLDKMPQRREALSCRRCARTFTADARYVDLTLTSGLQQKFEQKAWGGTELFRGGRPTNVLTSGLLDVMDCRSPLVSFAYERGWRQGFAWAGFPGADKEYDMAMEYLRPAYGKTLVDMSCGSGLFSRRFASSGQFSGVIAADFSESMLQQTQAYLREGGMNVGSTPVMLLRADVGRLPFATGSVAAIHAGAAIHCWPNPQAALAEISRVLAPGGVFVASTFLVAAAPLGEIFGDDAVRPFNALDATGARGPYRWWEEKELRDLCSGVGLQDFRRNRSWRFIMFSTTKPVGPQEEEQPEQKQGDEKEGEPARAGGRPLARAL